MQKVIQENKKNLKIKNINKFKNSEKDFIYHAGTQFYKNELRSMVEEY